MRQKKKILFVRRPLLGGGLENRMLSWFKFLESEYSDSVEVMLAVPQEKISVFSGRISSKIKLCPFVFKFGNFFVRFSNFFAFLKNLSDKPDLIFFAMGGFCDFNIAEILAAYLVSRGNTYISIHDIPEDPPNKPNKRYFGFIPALELWWWWEILQYKLRGYMVKKIYACSKKSLKQVKKWFDFLPYERFDVIYHGIDTNRFAPISNEEKNKLREKMGFHKDELIFVTVCRLVKWKRVEWVIKSFCEIMKTESSRKKMRLIIVGDGEERINLQKLAKKLNLDFLINFVGKRGDVDIFLKISDIFVLPSDKEPFGIAYIESMSCALITIGINKGGPTEIINSGIDGFLLKDDFNSINQFMKSIISIINTSYGKYIKENARKKVVDAFNAEKNVRKFVEQLISYV
ncbi:glycosyltransferase family 4 protein [Desulfonauticus submarinus]